MQVTATAVPEGQRRGFLPKLFGQHFMKGEAYVYAWMSRLCEEYQGGYWEFYDLSNGGGFLAPTHRQTPMKLSWASNYFEGSMTAEAAGIVATLYALSHLANETGDDLLIDHYDLLRDYAQEHPEAGLIFGAID